MATKRRPIARPLAARLSPAAIAGFVADDELALAAALGLPPWHASPIGARGACPWPPGSSGAESWPDAVALRKALLAAAAG